MRAVAAAILIATLAGCSTYGEVRSVVEDAIPPGAERIGECQEYGLYGVIEEPAYGCAFFVAGTQDAVTRALARRLVDAGFSARCNADELSGVIELAGEQGNVRVSADVGRRGSVITMSGRQPLNIHPDTRFLRSDYVRAPSEHVIVKITALEDGGRPLFANWDDCL